MIKEQEKLAEEIVEELTDDLNIKTLEWLYDFDYTDVEDNVFELWGGEIESVLEGVKEMVIEGLAKKIYKDDVAKEVYIVGKVCEVIKEKDCNEYNFLKLDVEIKKVFRLLYPYYPEEITLAKLRAMCLRKIYSGE